jgi:tRNA threonylcarbamoyl adenosine modification protein YeaZ
MLEEMLAEAGIGWSAVEGLAICTGPGNFTGLRLSVAAARGLALALGVPALGVTLLEALADRPGPVLATAQDRRGGYFAQVFNDGRALGEAVVAGDAAAIGPFPAGTTAVGFDAAAVAAACGLAAGDCVARADPLVLARIAARRLAHSTPPAPLYLRAADAMPPSEVPPRILDDA